MLQIVLHSYMRTLTIWSHYNSGVHINEMVNVYINMCIFTGNKAVLGSALLIYERKTSGLDVGMQVSIKDTHFIKNEILNADCNHLPECWHS